MTIGKGLQKRTRSNTPSKKAANATKSTDQEHRQRFALIELIDQFPLSLPAVQQPTPSMAELPELSSLELSCLARKAP